MVETRRLTRLVAAFSKRLELPDGRLVVGLSGGADSAVLSYLCSRLDRQVGAVHINHGLANSPMMEGAAVAIAQGLGVTIDVRHVVVPEGPSPEGQARLVRYSEFAVATESGEILLTAHTRDDNVETVLFNMIRGTGAKGLGGIPYYRPHNVFRPMLTITRAETRELATLAGLPFVDDPMNDDLSLTRNIIRSRVIPMLSELNPRLSESIARMSTAIASDNSHLDREAAQVTILADDEAVSVAVGDLIAVVEPIGDRVLKTMLTWTVGSDGVTVERVKSLWSVARGEIESLQLGSNATAIRRGPSLVIEPVRGRDDHQTVLLAPGQHRLGRLHFDVLAHDEVCKVVPLSRWSALFSPSTLLEATPDGLVTADGAPAWVPGERRMPVAWYEPGSVGYLSVFAREESGWTSNP